MWEGGEDIVETQTMRHSSAFISLTDVELHTGLSSRNQKRILREMQQMLHMSFSQVRRGRAQQNVICPCMVPVLGQEQGERLFHVHLAFDKNAPKCFPVKSDTD